jgi:hypothetical protein
VGDQFYISPEQRKKINTDDRMAKNCFKEVAKKIELVRKTSSPILKVIKFAHAMEELQGVDTAGGDIQGADESLPLIFYLMVTMKTDTNKYLGARFLEEFTYVNEFCHEEQLII